MDEKRGRHKGKDKHTYCARYAIEGTCEGCPEDNRVCRQQIEPSEEAYNKLGATLKLENLRFPPPANLHLRMGTPGSNFTICIHLKKTMYNRFRVWMFCRWFPFVIEGWDD